MTDQLANRTFATKMPDRPGAFMLASRIIMKRKGNIVRVSYNKDDDPNTLFVEVRASSDDLDDIERELNSVKYLKEEEPERETIVINIRMKDEPGVLYPVLEIFDRYDINLSYLNSNTDNGNFQNFKIGLIIEKPEIVKQVIDDICGLYQVNVINYTGRDNILDNTVSYIHLGNEVQKTFNLDMETTIDFVRESKRISKSLLSDEKDPGVIFNSIRLLSDLVSNRKGENFKPTITEQRITENIVLHAIEPFCGSNIYIMETEKELLFIDTGFGIYADETMDLIKGMFPNFYNMKKTILLTHADIYHCGLLSTIDDADIYLSQKSADILVDTRNNPDYKGDNVFYLGLSRLSRILSEFVPPQDVRFKILGENVPDKHEGLLLIDKFRFSDIEFEVYEGNGGHLPGELLFLSKCPGIVFTGDIFSKDDKNVYGDTAVNNILTELMAKDDCDSDKARKTLEDVNKMIEDLDGDGPLICNGHGPIAKP